jgi:PBSX family phage terminase large subunit
MSDLILSDKYKAFLRCKAPVEFLEGTTAAGKTTVGIFKFMLRVAESPKRQHILSGLDTGTIEKNIINKELGILDIFAGLIEYNPAGRGAESLPHMVFRTGTEDKIIYVLGYDNKARWKKALGGQYGCLLIDEINIADMEYVREAVMRCDYLMATLNPDDPALPIYSEYINHSRPLPEYDNDAPAELRNMLNQTVKPGWVWWYFSFDHNAGLSKEKKQKIIDNVPVGTKLYKNKILGLRGRATGLVFSNFDRSRHVITKEEAKRFIKDQRRRDQKEWFIKFTAGLDTAYSTKSPDTIAMSYQGITNKGRCILLSERVYNNAELNTPIAPSDTVTQYIAFLERCREEWGSCRDAFIDSADAGTITEFAKYKRLHGSIYNFVPAWKGLKVIDRINLQLGWFAHDQYLVVEDNTNMIRELESYSWKSDKDVEPEDGNDHMINSTQYGWLPFKHEIGVTDLTKQ